MIYLIIIIGLALGVLSFWMIIHGFTRETKKYKKYRKYINVEKGPDEFEKIYNELYSNYKASLEKKRKKLRRADIGISVGLILIFVGFCKFVVVGDIVGIAIIGIGIAVIYFFRDFIGQEKYIKEYVKEYKKEIISNFVKSISDKFNYRVDKIAYLQELNDYGLANFDNKKFNNYEADDYIEGNIDENSFFKMCEMHIQYIDNSRNTIENLFKGIFANIQSDRDIGTYIKITRDKLKIKSREDKVEMDSPEFEKYFDVYAEDKIMAMRILTADIMECLINFYNKYKLEFDIVFSGSNIYVRFFTGVMFEPKIYKNSMDKEILLEYYSILKFILELNQKVNKATQEIDI